MNDDLSRLPLALYLRKSSEDEGKQVLSIESQKNEMMQYAKDHGLKIVRVFEDEASAHTPNNRDNYMIMMDMVTNKEISGILTWKADRLARNMDEGGKIIHALQVGMLQVIQTRYTRFTPSDNMLPLTVELGMANQFSIDLSRNVKRGNKTKVEQGGHCAVAPCGYLNDVINKTVIPDPERFHLVRKMWDLYLKGTYSVPAICKVANEQWGFRTVKRKKMDGGGLTVSGLYKIFKNPFYYGWVKKGNNENWGTHQAMVTQVEHEKANELLRREGRKGETSYEFPLTGFIKCGECDSAITAEEKVKYFCSKCRCPQTSKNPHPCRKCGHQITKKDISNGNWYKYYRCTKKKLKDGNKCTQACIRDNNIEEEVLSILSSIEIDPDFEEWAVKWLKFENEVQFNDKAQDTKTFQKHYNHAEEKLKRLVEMRIERELTQEEFLVRKKEIDLEIKQSKSGLESAEKRRDDWIEKAEKELGFVQGIQERFRNGSIKEKKFIFSQIGSNFIFLDGKLNLQVEQTYLLFRDLEKVADLTVEPQRSQSVTSITPRSGGGYFRLVSPRGIEPLLPG